MLSSNQITSPLPQLMLARLPPAICPFPDQDAGGNDKLVLQTPDSDSERTKKITMGSIYIHKCFFLDMCVFLMCKHQSTD